MGLLGISLIVASVVWVVLRPPAWLTPLQVLLRWRGTTTTIQGPKRDASAGSTQTDAAPSPPPGKDRRGELSDHQEVEPSPRALPGLKPKSRDSPSPSSSGHGQQQPSAARDQVDGVSKQRLDAAAMPPPPPPPSLIVQPPTLVEPEEQTTPKATAALAPPVLNIPSFALDDEPAPPSMASVRAPVPQLFAPTPSASMMPPPPPPGRLPPAAAGRVPSLAQFPAANSPQRARGPAPSRAPPGGSGLAPPPTITAKPSKPSRKVLLTPGHSPLDWARISGPSSDLRGLPPSTAYLRVTPSMLKHYTGRKGKDAWMALNGKVYNITPYADFHPGGVPELMRGAGRDGTELFGRYHPWVNYETMLSSCLVGLLVEESEGSKPSQMDEMD